MSQELTVGITGASGGLYARRLLLALEAAPAVEVVNLVVSAHARTALEHELGVPRTGPLDLKRLAGTEPFKIREHAIDAVDSRIASGSNPSLGMVVVPCSMGTVARIAHGISDSLLTRAADVCLKERRRLVLVPRETPLSRVHLQNLLHAAEAGAIILAAMPAFYHHPHSIEDVADQLVARVLDHLAIAHTLGRAWNPAGREI